MKYLEENIGVLKIQLTADELQDLEAVFPLGVAAGERYSEIRHAESEPVRRSAPRPFK